MKVLWIVNFVFPDAAKTLGIATSASGGWLLDLAKNIAELENIELATFTYYAGKNFQDIKVNNIRHFIFPGGGKRLLLDNPKTVQDCRKVIAEFKPDLIHIHGTEYAPALAVLEAAPQIPTVLTIQGIIKRISQEYYGGLSRKERLKTFRLKDAVKLKTIYSYKKLFEHNAKREYEVLSRVKYVTGRTDWDKTTMLSVNPKLTYFRCNYNLREAFYNPEKWNIENIQRHKIVTGAGGYSLKGLHILLRAVAIVKNQYPDVRLHVPGGKANNGKLVAVNGYTKYIKRLLSELGIEENVIFDGSLPAEKVRENLLSAHVCVVPSAMEGASATVCEAMMVGTPAICSYRGGMTELLTDGVNGFTYDFPEYPFLAEKIMRIFEDDELALRFSELSLERAEARHNRNRNPQDMVRVYEEILKRESTN